MSVVLHHASSITHVMSAAVPMKGLVVGAIGGLLGTLAMDVCRAGTFWALGIPANLSFSIIGDAAAGFFSVLGIHVTGGAAWGGALYYLIGPALGGVLTTTICHTHAFRVSARRIRVSLSILSAEIMSLPLLAIAAIVLRMPASEAIQWFGISFVLHLVYGLVLGIVVDYGLRPEPKAGEAG